MSTFAEFESTLINTQQIVMFRLIAAQLNISGCSQGRIIDTCRQSGYSADNTLDLITRLAECGLVELSVTQESPIQVIVTACGDAELQGVLA